jgi:fibronectin type 3 domain-containing protein
MIYRNTTSGAKNLLSEIGNQNYYNDTSVSNFVTYYYDVCAKSPDGEGNVSNEVSIFPYLLPSSPTSLSAESRDDFINLSWNPPVTDGGSPIVNYTIYRRYLFGKTPIAKVANTTFYNDTNVFSGFTYYYSVSASNIGGEGTLSDEIVAKIILPPGVPWFITTSIGDSYCLLNWSKPFSSGGSHITNYRIYRSTISGEEEFLAETDNSTSYNDTTVTTGITYYYKISAKNLGGEGDLSEEVSAKLGTLPQAPTNLEAVSGSFMGVSVVTLSWDPPADTGGIPITNYKIYRGKSSGDLSFLADAGNITVYVDSDVKESERYYYKVVAENDMGVGVSSSEINTSPEDITTTSILALLALFGIIGLVIVVIIVVMVFRKKKAKKKAEEEAQIGFEGGAWDQAQQPQPGFSPDQPPMEGYPSPAMPQPGSEGQNTLIYICPHCQEKYSAQRPSKAVPEPYCDLSKMQWTICNRPDYVIIIIRNPGTLPHDRMRPSCCNLRIAL